MLGEGLDAERHTETGTDREENIRRAERRRRQKAGVGGCWSHCGELGRREETSASMDTCTSTHVKSMFKLGTSPILPRRHYLWRKEEAVS